MNNVNKNQQKSEKSKLLAIESNKAFPVVGLGASAGGLDAIKKLLENLPQDNGLALVVIQHLSPNQESMLPEILSRSTKMTVHKVESGMEIDRNNVYVIPSGRTMTISNSTLKLHPKLGSLKPIDEFLNSLALERKTQAIGIVLSGTGNDGTQGLKKIKAEGGITFAQDPKTAQYPDMPKNAIAEQAVDFILSPEQIAEELKSIVTHPELTRQKIEAEYSKEKQETDLQAIFGLLKASSGVNFSNYKRNTILRRITRRLVLNKIDTTKKYVNFLRENPAERQALFDDMLINVTGFFREPNTFSIIQQKVLPDLIKGLKPNNRLRVWVPGCSSGEEAYSIAIALTEFLEENDKIDIQIFGTDVNIKNIETARRGIYHNSIEDHVSKRQLERYFTKTNGNYQITKVLRDKCIFAKHDLTQDPPFSNLDIIICRNVLIYIDTAFQENIMSIFNYALNPGGYLVLGESESVGKFTNVFEQIAKGSPIFKKKVGQNRIEVPLQSSAPYFYEKPQIKSQEAYSAPTLKEEIDKLLLDKYVPATLLINDNSDILMIRGQVNPFISVEPGTPTFNVSKIIRKELRPTVQTAIYRAKKSKKDVEETLRFEEENKSVTINIKVKQLKNSKEDPFFLVFLDKTTKSSPEEQTKTTQPGGALDRAKDQQQIRELSEDLETTRQTLQTVIEQQEASNEELRSANEEVQSSNEELMSTNEELETSKEELQSTNEELNTLNDELKNRNQNLSRLNDDLNNLMKNVDTAVIIVDNDFRIKRFTASAEELLRLTPADVDHVITDLRLGVPIDDLKEPLSEVTAKLTIVRKEINAGKNRWLQMRIRPYITENKKIGGAVISFANVSEMKKWESEKKLYAESLETRVKEQTEKILLSENLASIGRTAGMVGHDIRNPLQAIISDVYIAETELASIPESKQKNCIKESLIEIESNIDYINKIVQDLQDYARPLNPNPGEADLKLIIENLLKKSGVPENVKVSVKVEDDARKIVADADYVIRILYNLVTNAVQAMPKGGRLTIHVYKEVNDVVITVNDTGVGIPKAIQSKMFTPMFTTKSKGQGFGLPVVKRMTESLGGTVSFESEEGNGTTFTIRLPQTIEN